MRCILLLLLRVALVPVEVQSFLPPANVVQVRRDSLRLFLSDIPREEKPEKEKTDVFLNLEKFMPPPPEDTFVMTGDIAALFVYSFMDHFASDVLMAGVPQLPDSLPVWFDLATSSVDSQQVLSTYVQPHSLLLSTAGFSSVALTSCWLLAGYCRGAFLIRNTLDCTGPRALGVTAQTWLTTCILMVALVFGIQQCLPDTALVESASFVPGMTTPDAAFVLDSLSVLVMWRFMANTLLGYGREHDDDE